MTAISRRRAPLASSRRPAGARCCWSSASSPSCRTSVPGPGDAAPRREPCGLRDAQRCARLGRGQPRLDRDLRGSSAAVIGGLVGAIRGAACRAWAGRACIALAGGLGPDLRWLASGAAWRGRACGHRRPGPLGVGHGDARPDARRGAHLAGHRHPARHRRRPEPAFCGGGRAAARRHADHADVRLPRPR